MIIKIFLMFLFGGLFTVTNGFNRERLAKIIFEDMREGFFKFLHPINDYPEWDKADERWRTTAYRQADAIIAEEKSILEVLK